MPPSGIPTAVALVLRAGMLVAQGRPAVRVDRDPVIHPDGPSLGPRRRALPGMNRKGAAADPAIVEAVNNLLNQ